MTRRIPDYDAMLLGDAEPHDDEAFMSEWERDFVASVTSQDYDLTYAQQEKLDEIEQRVADRRTMWREGWRGRFWRR